MRTTIQARTTEGGMVFKTRSGAGSEDTGGTCGTSRRWSIIQSQRTLLCPRGTTWPISGETVIEKKLPNAFAGTDLQRTLATTGRRHLVVVGFMTHMCLSSTVRAALDLGYATTVVSSVTATRDLPDGQGGTIPASAVQKVSLAALADRFAVVVDKVEEVPD